MKMNEKFEGVDKDTTEDVDKTVDYNKVLFTVAKDRGWDEQGILNFDNFRNQVGAVESNNIYDRLQGDSEKGIGRGAYQYETSKGSGTNSTAVTRLKKVLKDTGYDFSNLPKEDLAILRTEDPDFSKVSPPTQDLLFLADKLQHPTFAVNDLAEGKLSPMDAWLDYHWSGSKKERPNKVALWNRTFI